VEEQIIPPLNAEYEPTNAYGAVARAHHCSLYLKTEGCRQGLHLQCL